MLLLTAQKKQIYTNYNSYTNLICTSENTVSCIIRIKEYNSIISNFPQSSSFIFNKLLQMYFNVIFEFPHTNLQSIHNALKCFIQLLYYKMSLRLKIWQNTEWRLYRSLQNTKVSDFQCILYTRCYALHPGFYSPVLIKGTSYLLFIWLMSDILKK